jgi:hypothetical protein
MVAESTNVTEKSEKNEKIKSIWRRLSYFDMLETPIKLSFRGRTKMSSLPTQILSVVLVIALLAMLNIYLKQYIVNGGVSIQKSVVSSTGSYQIDSQFAD